MLPGAFHALLQNMAVSAFDNATPHRQACLAKGGVLSVAHCYGNSTCASGGVLLLGCVAKEEARLQLAQEHLRLSPP